MDLFNFLLRVFTALNMGWFAIFIILKLGNNISWEWYKIWYPPAIVMGCVIAFYVIGYSIQWLVNWFNK